MARRLTTTRKTAER